MSVYYQFKSSTVKESIGIDGLFITVGELKLSILEKKILRRNRKSSDSDIILSNYETKEDYVDDGTLIPRHATVWIRRVPVHSSGPLKPIIANPPPVPVAPEEPEVVEIDPEDLEWEELVNVINGTETLSSQSRKSAPDEMDEDSKIKALVEKPALDWQNGSGGFGWETPHPGYVCHRCKIPGHFIKHCPTNGDPEYDDFKRVRRPAGIPKSMLVAAPNGSYALPTGEVAVLKPNEAAFERAMEGVPSSSRSVDHQLPPELHCRICRKVMKDAVLTSRCCFDSFCDRCIRNHIITKFSCVCGATNVLADDLIPNLTLRGTINRILESNSSGSSGEIISQVLPVKQESVSVKESAPSASQESGPLPDVEAEKKPVLESAPAATQSIGPLPNVEVEKKPVSDKTAEKKPVSDKTAEKKALPVATPYENYMMSMGYNPYWGVMQHVAYNTGYLPYGFVPMNMPFGVEQNMINPGYNAGGPHEVRRANEKRKRDDEKYISKAASNSDHLQQPQSHRRSTDRSHDHKEHSRWSRSHDHHHSESAEKEEGALKKRNLSSSSKGYHESRTTSLSSRKSLADDERNDDERHFKRLPSWYKSSTPAMMKREEESERAMKRGRQERSRSRDGRFSEGDRIGRRALVA